MMAYNPLCKEHQMYANDYLIEIRQLELGIISELPLKIRTCFVCGETLTLKEIESLKATDFQPLCSKHSEVRKLYQFHKEWFEFKEQNPGAKLNENGTMPKEFFIYLQTK
jgi:hypothetical protein